MAFVELRSITKRYGPTLAVDGADLDVGAGEVHVLIGANGCGKSTICKILAGTVAPDSGTVRLDGAERRFRSPKDAARAGVSVFFQELSLVPVMTVAENVFLGREPRRFGLVDASARRRLAQEAFEPFRGVVSPSFSVDALARDASADERQITEILKTVSEDGRLVIFDEATASLDRAQVAVFFELVRRLKAEGKAIVFISHRMDEIFAIGDRVSVMREGRIVETSAVRDTSPERVVATMTGGQPTGPAGGPARPRALSATPGSAPVLAVEALTAPRLGPVSFDVFPGEVVGLGGLHGQGQSALLRTLFGLGPARGGSVRIGGERLAPGAPALAIRAGLAYVSGDRGRDGVAAIRPILENLSYAALARERPLVYRPGAMGRRLKPVIERLSLKFERLSDPARSLSGGNQQKLVIGRWLAASPRLILLDDPTKGIDVSAKADLYRALAELAAGGVAILFHSSEDSELLENASRILVFNAGRVSAELSGAAMTRASLNEAAFAHAPGREAA